MATIGSAELHHVAVSNRGGLYTAAIFLRLAILAEVLATTSYQTATPTSQGGKIVEAALLYFETNFRLYNTYLYGTLIMGLLKRIIGGPSTRGHRTAHLIVIGIEYFSKSKIYERAY